MDYKRAYRVLGIILIISTMLMVIYLAIESFSQTDRIKKSINLTDDEKRNVNYRQLVQDIKSVENFGKVKNAKQIADDVGSKENGPTKVISIPTYYGDGYTVSEPGASDVTIYEFYVDGKCVYAVVKPEGGYFGITKQVKIMLLLFIIVIMGITEFMFYVKYKKISKNDKNIEDKKSV